MSNKKKILLIVLASIILLVAGCGVAYAVAPRDFLQLVLSDSAYTKVMLGKNLAKTYPAAEKMIASLDEKQFGLTADGSISATFDSSVFGSEKASQSVSEYVSSLNMDASLNVDGLLADVKCDLSDNDGSVITAEGIMDPSSTYLNVKQLGLGWLNMDIEEGEEQHDVGTVNKTYEKIVDEKVDDDIREAVYDYAKTAVSTFDDDNISIAAKKEINVGSLTAKGDVITVLLTSDDLIKCIDATVTEICDDEKTYEKVNSCLPGNEKMTYQEYKTKVLELRDAFVQKIKDSELKTANLDFFVDKRNNITAIDVDLGSESVTNKISAIISDEKDRGISLCIKEEGKTTLLVDLIKSDDSNGTITFTNETANGQLSIKAHYSDLQIDEDGIYGRLTTDPFTMPTRPDFGPISLDVTVKQADENLNISINANIEKFAVLDISLNAKKTEFKEFALPSAGDITPYDKDKVQSATMNYLLKEMPKTHPQFKSVYSAILTSSVNGAVSDLISALTGKDNFIGSILGSFVDGGSLTEGVTGIIGSAINGDTSGIADTVNNFLKAFHLKESE